MTIDKKQLQAQFDIQYNEFKEAEDFLKSYTEEKTEDFQTAIKELLEKDEKENLELAIELVREYKTVPKMLAMDLDFLKEKVLAGYSIIQNVLEIPQEQLEKIQEISKFKNKTIFIRDKGVNSVLNEPYYNSIINSTKDENYIKLVVDVYKKMYEDSLKKE